MAQERITNITTTSEPDCYVITFPAYTTLKDLENWGAEFKAEPIDKKGFNLLIDTNRHEFESIECLNWLKSFLTQEGAIRQAIRKVAFAQPTSYRSPEIVSDYEAYFSDINSARVWLNLVNRGSTRKGGRLNRT